ncbi:hypothetical protein DLAC_01598 [Tieghemostelium lacteum]|uniref:Ribosomal RNA-processing protein 8 n=1 Tax=Tieghemostelium lacteum TaxID=361077 RepID=A0A152A5U7_TIELA|nr:hypothetical protein DLAC_01598 [Tieghemostelium lacteum]|eukprot:KYR01598.1 hypothetical protein DLAC_01598 [Tieghemostelium lacteum]
MKKNNPKSQKQTNNSNKIKIKQKPNEFKSKKQQKLARSKQQIPKELAKKPDFINSKLNKNTSKNSNNSKPKSSTVLSIVKKSNDPFSQPSTTQKEKKFNYNNSSKEEIAKAVINNDRDDNEKFNLWNPKPMDSENSKQSKLTQEKNESLKGSKFRWLNELLYTSESKEALKEFKENPKLFDEYHSGFKSQVEHWPINPLDLIIEDLQKSKKKLKIADLGCGEAKLAERLQDQHQVHSFDLVAVNDRVTACDIASVPLEKESVDTAVFCLSLMGTNFLDFLTEAHRILAKNGILRIAEIESRIENIQTFVDAVEQLNFKLLKKNTSHQYFTLFQFTKNTQPQPNKKKQLDQQVILKPCLYKKR